LPNYHVKHYTKSYTSANVIQSGSDVTIDVEKGTNGIKPGTYIGDTYEVTLTFDISQLSGRTILDVWALPSLSTSYGDQPVIAEVNPVLEWVGNSQTTAQMKAYIYFIKYKPGGLLPFPINQFLPAGGFNGKMSLSVYSYSADVTGIKQAAITPSLLQIVPNPSTGYCNVKFMLQKNSDVAIEIVDIAGKVVYTKYLDDETIGHKEIPLNLENLSAGMYICNITTTDGVISRKVSISR